ncbi:MAG: SGNH/GDSL hydrolase family protein, partial [Clostridia bacterium]|nr:SGNH/GDSL hydrolase family protein [Clostridia bacterium]
DGYALMLSRITKKYPNADVFCFTVLPCYDGSGTLLNKYNNVIRSLAEHFNLPVVDLHSELGITYYNYDAYYLDEIHPNALGMKLIADEFVETMYEYYKG